MPPPHGSWEASLHNALTSRNLEPKALVACIDNLSCLQLYITLPGDCSISSRDAMHELLEETFDPSLAPQGVGSCRTSVAVMLYHGTSLAMPWMTHVLHLHRIAQLRAVVRLDADSAPLYPHCGLGSPQMRALMLHLSISSASLVRELATPGMRLAVTSTPYLRWTGAHKARFEETWRQVRLADNFRAFGLNGSYDRYLDAHVARTRTLHPFGVEARCFIASFFYLRNGSGGMPASARKGLLALGTVRSFAWLHVVDDAANATFHALVVAPAFVDPASFDAYLYRQMHRVSEGDVQLRTLTPVDPTSSLDLISPLFALSTRAVGTTPPTRGQILDYVNTVVRAVSSNILPGFPAERYDLRVSCSFLEGKPIPPMVGPGMASVVSKAGLVLGMCDTRVLGVEFSVTDMVGDADLVRYTVRKEARQCAVFYNQWPTAGLPAAAGEQDLDGFPAVVSQGEESLADGAARPSNGDISPSYNPISPTEEITRPSYSPTSPSYNPCSPSFDRSRYQGSLDTSLPQLRWGGEANGELGRKERGRRVSQPAVEAGDDEEQPVVEAGASAGVEMVQPAVEAGASAGDDEEQPAVEAGASAGDELEQPVVEPSDDEEQSVVEAGGVESEEPEEPVFGSGCKVPRKRSREELEAVMDNACESILDTIEQLKSNMEYIQRNRKRNMRVNYCVVNRFSMMAVEAAEAAQNADDELHALSRA